MTQETNINPALILISLRYDVDCLIKEPINGEYWWLKPYILNGERIGITECCEYGIECEHHKSVRIKIETQNIESN